MPEGTLSSPERPTDTRPQLLFHGTRGSRAELIAEYGLLANTRTLTPNLELAFKDSSDTGIVTCWKPLKGDVKGGKPIQVITEDQRAEMIDKVLATDPDKSQVLEFMRKAETILPPSRLFAIGTFPSADKWQLYLHSPSKDPNFFKRYTNEHEELVKSVEGVLGNIRIKFFDPTFNNRLLAEDVVHAWVEHRLLYIGINLKRTQQDMGKEYFTKDAKNMALSTVGYHLKDLQDVQFQEPVYERYRNMLISQISSFLQKSSF